MVEQPDIRVKKLRSARTWSIVVVVLSLTAAGIGLTSPYSTWWGTGLSLLVAALAAFNVVKYQRMIAASSS